MEPGKKKKIRWLRGGFRVTAPIALLLALLSASSAIRAHAVSYRGVIKNAGPTAAVRYSTDGYDLFSTAPPERITRTWYGYDGAFRAGEQLQKLPPYISKIAAPPGIDTASAAGFQGYSLIDNPSQPGKKIRAGFEVTHAPNGRAIVPLVLINLSSYATIPKNWYIGFITNIHRGRVDDYPSVIQVTCGESKVTVKTGRDGGHPNGGIDVYFFRMTNLQPGDRITIGAASGTRNFTGGAFNPSISGLLFTERVPRASAITEIVSRVVRVSNATASVAGTSAMPPAPKAQTNLRTNTARKTSSPLARMFRQIQRAEQQQIEPTGQAVTQESPVHGGQPPWLRLFSTLSTFYLAFYWITLIGVAAINILVCWILQRCLASIPKELRQQEPALAWLLLIPIFNVIWMFFIFLPLARGYQAYFQSRGRTDKGDCGYHFNRRMCIYTLLAPIIPIIGWFIFSIVSFVMFIVAMIKAWHFKGLIEADRAGAGEPPVVPVSNFAMATASVAAPQQSPPPPPPPVRPPFHNVSGASKPPPQPLSRTEPPPAPHHSGGGPPPPRLAGMPPPLRQAVAPMAFATPPAAIRESTVRPTTTPAAVIPPPLVNRGTAAAQTSEFLAGSGTGGFYPAPPQSPGGLRWGSPGATAGQPLHVPAAAATNAGAGGQVVRASVPASGATHGIVSRKRVTTMAVIAAIIALSAVLPWAVVSESVIGINTTTAVMGFYFWQAGVCTALGMLILACTIVLLANGSTAAAVVRALKWAVLSGFIAATLVAILGIFLPASTRYKSPPQYTTAMRTDRRYENMFPSAVQSRINATIDAYTPKLSVIPIAPVGVVVLAAAGIVLAAVECRSAG